MIIIMHEMLMMMQGRGGNARKKMKGKYKNDIAYYLS